jgi:hypothetical protein
MPLKLGWREYLYAVTRYHLYRKYRTFRVLWFGRKLCAAKALLWEKGGYTYTNEIFIGRPINGLPNRKAAT